MSTSPIGPFERLARHVAVYAVGDILIRAAAFLLIPLYTRRLTIEDFGVLGLVQMMDAALVLVLNMGMSTAIMRRTASGGSPRRPPGGSTDSDLDRRGDVFTAFVTTALVSLIVLGAGLLAGPRVIALVFDGAIGMPLLAALFAGTAFGTLKLFALSLVRAEGRAHRYVVVNLLHFVVLMGTSILFVAVMDLGLAGAIVAQPLSAGVALAALVPFLLARMAPRWRGDALRGLLAYGLPLMPGMLAMWVITMSNRLVIQHLRDVAEVGVFTLAFRLALPLQIAIVTPFRTAWLPVLFGLEREEIDRVASLALGYFLAVGGFVGLCLSLLGPALVSAVATPGYAQAATVLPLLVLGFLLYGIYFNADNGVLLGRRTGVYPWVVGGAALLNVALNVVLVGRMGIVGAGLAAVLSYLVLTLAMFAVSRRVHPIRYDVRRALVPLVSAVGLYALAGGAIWESGPIARAGAIAAYPVLLAVFGFFRASERRRLRELLGRRSR